MLPRFFCPELAPAGQEMALPEAVAHHADRVLRLKPGQEVSLFDGEGREARAELLAFGRDPRARIAELAEIDREPPIAITLVQALATGDKMDWIVQKAVELGVTSFQPVSAERSVLRLDGERAAKRVEHWRQVAVSAAEQCGCRSGCRPLSARRGGRSTRWRVRGCRRGQRRRRPSRY